MADQQGLAGFLGKGFKIFLGDTVSFAILDYIKGFARGLGNKATETVKERIENLIKNNPRVDLLYVLLTLNSQDATTLWNRHREAILNGTEDNFVKILGQALPRTPDGKLDEIRAKAVFSEIAKMDRDRFCQVLEELNHDPIAQRIKFLLKKGKNIGESIMEGLAYFAGALSRKGAEINENLEQKAQDIEAWLEEQEFPKTDKNVQPKRSIFGWYAKKHRGLL